MKVIIDSNIPFIKGVLESLADIVYADSKDIDAATVKDADALIIRTRTKCDSDLLKGSKVRFIGTATIGTDHIDIGWCRKNSIEVTGAPGCNSGSVMQYLASSLIYLAGKYNIDPSGTTLGVIGVGNAGSKVARMAEHLGFRILLNDPPRERDEGKKIFTELNDLLHESDIVSLHVPLTYDGPYKTCRLANTQFFSAMKRGSFLINTSRGKVIDERSLFEQINSSHIRGTVLDVWNNEPYIDTRLLSVADIGTAHIAGYSADGKANATMDIVRQLAYFFDLPLKVWKPDPLRQPDHPVINTDEYSGAGFRAVSKIISHTYNVEDDNILLKNNPDQFELLRSSYRYRREFHAYKVKGENKLLSDKLIKLGFSLAEAEKR